MPDKKLFAFVLMPFDSGFRDLYRFGIKEAAASAGFVAERVDEQRFSEGMLDRIYRQIEAADVVIAEMTGKNPNVFYEVGYAHAKGKLCILSTADASDIPFDLLHRRHIVHGRSIEALAKGLKSELEWAREELSKLRTSGITVSMTANADLESDEIFDWALLDLHIKLQNNGKGPSPDIEAVYLFSGHQWNMKADGQACPRSTEAVAPFKYSFFIKPPVRRLTAGGWATVLVNARRMIGSKAEGTRREGGYPIKGKMLVRLATTAGNFDYEVFVDAFAEQFPF